MTVARSIIGGGGYIHVLMFTFMFIKEWCRTDEYMNISPPPNIDVPTGMGDKKICSWCSVKTSKFPEYLIPNTDTYILFRELRDNTPTQILLNFCVSLSLTLIVFLVGAERSKTFSMTGCRIAAIALHFFVLATFMWMGISAYNMYLSFVKVLNSYFPNFMLKCSVVAWGKL